MKRLTDRIKLWFESESCEYSTPEKGEIERIEFLMESAYSRMMRNLLPFFLIALIINLLIMFNVPIEVTKKQWFWLKELFSLGMAYIIFRSIRLMWFHLSDK